MFNEQMRMSHASEHAIGCGPTDRLFEYGMKEIGEWVHKPENAGIIIRIYFEVSPNFSFHCIVRRDYKMWFCLPLKKKWIKWRWNLIILHTVTELVWISFVWIPTSQSGVWIYGDIVPFTVIKSAPFFVTWRKIKGAISWLELSICWRYYFKCNIYMYFLLFFKYAAVTLQFTF